MNLNNKVVVHRGMDFMNQRPAGLTLEWTSREGATRTDRPTGGDFCVLWTNTLGTEVKMWMLTAAVTAGFTISDAEIAKYRDLFYVCYQGKEETENVHFLVKDKFIKFADMYMTIPLYNVNATQFSEIKTGDFVLLDVAGKVGTTSISTTPGGIYFTVAAAKVLPGTCVVAANETLNTDGTTPIYTITVVC